MTDQQRLALIVLLSMTIGFLVGFSLGKSLVKVGVAPEVLSSDD